MAFKRIDLGERKRVTTNDIRDIIDTINGQDQSAVEDGVIWVNSERQLDNLDGDILTKPATFIPTERYLYYDADLGRLVPRVEAPGTLGPPSPALQLAVHYDWPTKVLTFAWYNSDNDRGWHTGDIPGDEGTCLWYVQSQTGTIVASGEVLAPRPSGDRPILGSTETYRGYYKITTARFVRGQSYTVGVAFKNEHGTSDYTTSSFSVASELSQFNPTIRPDSFMLNVQPHPTPSIGFTRTSATFTGDEGIDDFMYEWYVTTAADRNNVLFSGEFTGRGHTRFGQASISQGLFGGVNMTIYGTDTFVFHIRSRNFVGSSNYWTHEFTVASQAEAPETPTGLAVTYNRITRTLHANWNRTMNATSYFWTLVLRGTIIASGTTTGTSISHDITLIDGTTYQFGVSAVNIHGSSAFATDNVTPTVPPRLGTPDNITIDMITHRSARIMWDSVEGANQYSVRVVDSTDMDTGYDDTQTVTATTATFFQLDADTMYNVEVVAIDTTLAKSNSLTGTGSFSTTVQLPDAIDDVVISYDIVTNILRVSWDSVEGAASYPWRLLNPGNNNEVVASSTTTMTTLSQSTVLTAGVEYLFGVAVRNDAGTSAYYEERFTPRITETLPMLTGLFALKVSNTSFNVVWNPISNAQEYVVTYGISGQTATTSLTTRARTITLTGLSTNIYRVTVVARNSAKYFDSPPATLEYILTVDIEGVTLTRRRNAAGNPQFIVSWDSIPTATSSRVELMLGQTSRRIDIRGNTNTATFDLSSLFSINADVTVSIRTTVNNIQIVYSEIFTVATQSNLSVGNLRLDTDGEPTWNIASGASAYRIWYSYTNVDGQTSTGVSASGVGSISADNTSIPHRDEISGPFGAGGGIYFCISVLQDGFTEGNAQCILLRNIVSAPTLSYTYSPFTNQFGSGRRVSVSIDFPTITPPSGYTLSGARSLMYSYSFTANDGTVVAHRPNVRTARTDPYILVDEFTIYDNINPGTPSNIGSVRSGTRINWLVSFTTSATNSERQSINIISRQRNIGITL